jgi:hypothetical protein
MGHGYDMVVLIYVVDERLSFIDEWPFIYHLSARYMIKKFIVQLLKNLGLNVRTSLIT